MNAKTAENKNHPLHALCPYFAMFPPSFVREQLDQHTRTGDVVCDPFSGRGTTVLEALLNERQVIAGDINPVAAVVSGAKATTPSLGRITARLVQLSAEYRKRERVAPNLPEFFYFAFHVETLRQLTFLRRRLAWRTSNRDRFIAALVLGHLHGESQRSPSYLSAQMPHTISPKPDYCVKYWQQRDLLPPERDVFELLKGRAIYRLSEGLPPARGKVANADVRHLAGRLRQHRGTVSAVITSPPYLDITNFEEDQWLRLWFLGGPPHPTYREVSRDDRHRGAEAYFSFLTSAWQGIKPLMKQQARLVCRIGAKAISADVLRDRLTKSVRTSWPKAAVLQDGRPSDLRKRQTGAFRPGTVGCGTEYDFVYELR